MSNVEVVPIMTTGDLIEVLKEFPPEQLVMIAVCKYPEEFCIRFKDGEPSWDTSTDVEVLPLEAGEIVTLRGMTTLMVELADYDAQRHLAGG
jgi:hypothetical protein